MRTLVLAAAVIVLLPAVARPAAQQGASEITGRIVDSHGGVLPGVAIVVTNEETGLFRETISGAGGTYFVPHLWPGLYRIVAIREGFRTVQRRGLRLQLGTTLTVNLTLEVGGRHETVIVTSALPLVGPTSAEGGGNIGTVELTRLPCTPRSDQSKWRFAKARPDPDFRYCSNRVAWSSSQNSTTT